MDKLGRAVGFVMLAGAALVILAGVLLLPDYARMAEARYQLACQRVANADLQAQIRANDHLIAAMPADQVLAKRMAMNQLGLWPADEVVVIDSRFAPPRPPSAVAIYPRSRPKPPGGWLLTAAQRVAHPPTRRGLMLLSAIAIAAAAFLFPPRERPSSP